MTTMTLKVNSVYMTSFLSLITIVTHAGIAASVSRAFSRVCRFVCLSVCPLYNRKTG